MPVMSMVTNTVLDCICTTQSHRIPQWNQGILQIAQLQVCNAVLFKRAASDNCFALIDGTVWPICRPREHQCVVCNGHKRVHVLKF